MFATIEHMNKPLNSRGFTIIELMVCIVVIAAISVLAITNLRSIRADRRDEVKKTDINAVFFQLESFHQTNGYYPKIADAAALKGIDPESLTDASGKKISEAESLYSYTPTGCVESKCKGYELRTDLEREAPYIKLSLIR